MDNELLATLHERSIEVTNLLGVLRDNQAVLPDTTKARIIHELREHVAYIVVEVAKIGRTPTIVGARPRERRPTLPITSRHLVVIKE